jgi:hypothetical protein
MKKMAIFVEGQTEQIFVEKLLIEIAGRHRLRVESFRMWGGRRYPRLEYRLGPEPAQAGQRFYALIVDCGGDARIVSEINDRYETLVSAGHIVIIGMRDVAPEFRFNDKPKLLAAFAKNVTHTSIIPLLVLATMEIEAWFLAEHTHFERIDESLTTTKIQTELGIDLTTDDIERRERPSRDLHDIYCLCNLIWTKSQAEVERTVNALDFALMYLSAGTRVPSLTPLLTAIDSFLS